MSDAIRRGLLALCVLVAGCSSSGDSDEAGDGAAVGATPAPVATTTADDPGDPGDVSRADVEFSVWPVLGADVTPEQCAEEVVDTWCRADDGPRIGADAIESAEARFQDQAGWVVDLVFTGAGIEAFNELAAACYELSPVCPTARLAIEIDGRVVSAPQVQAPAFARDSIVISGVLDQAQAEEIAAALSG